VFGLIDLVGHRFDAETLGIAALDACLEERSLSQTEFVEHAFVHGMIKPKAIHGPQRQGRISIASNPDPANEEGKAGA
jgi:hypothetical protein